jgi:hypothetical protein
MRYINKCCGENEMDDAIELKWISKVTDILK